MYLLYSDESGSPDDPSADIFVLAGVAVFERQTHWIDSELTKIVTRYNPQNPENLELHAGPMRAGKDGWENFSVPDRVQATVDVLSLLNNSNRKLVVFASVIQKSLLARQDIVSTAFEKLACSFDDFLALCYTKSKGKNPQRGIVIFDEAHFERNVQALSWTFKHKGHQAGKLRNFSEVPLFLDSKASRLIQLADMVAYWIYRYYQAHDSRGFDLIKPYIYNYDHQKSGLHELISGQKKQDLLSSPHSDVAKYPFPNPTEK